MNELRKKGFTLVEVLVSIAILLVVVTATMSAAADALSTTIFAKEQVTAYFLAQEAVEMIKNLKTQNYLRGIIGGGSDSIWLCGNIPSETPLNGYCNLTPTSFEIEGRIPSNVMAVRTNSSERLLYDSSNGSYSYSGSGIQSPYTRTVSIKMSSDCSSALVTVIIGWTKGTRNGSLTVQETIYNWN